MGGSLREVVGKCLMNLAQCSLGLPLDVMDHRQLDFDKPEPGSETKRGQPGAKRYKDKR